MVKLIATCVAAASVVLLLAGYLASQYAAMHDSSAVYAEKMDAAPIRLLALLVLLGAIVAAFLYKSEEPG